MRHQTRRRQIQAWNNMREDHDFEDQEEFFEIAALLGEVDGDGSSFHYCPQRADEPLGPENLKLVQVVTDSCWDKVLHPAI
ncbi:hypothetical protein [Neorhodopirellula lusitana]|uniref:hypothetical protein n=1 Tax=Neorhodopirellula lusitana TaxID=445327 RepID=UPI00384D28FF